MGFAEQWIWGQVDIWASGFSWESVVTVQKWNLDYYITRYLSSQSISGVLHADSIPFTKWVSELKVKGLNIDAETLYYLKAIYQMSLNYGGELAFYISPTPGNGVAIIVIFGSGNQVDSTLTAGERNLFTGQLGFKWNSFFIHGHTHFPGHEYVSDVDVATYGEVSCLKPWAMQIVIQQNQMGQIVIMNVGFYYFPFGAYKEMWISP